MEQHLLLLKNLISASPQEIHLTIMMADQNTLRKRMNKLLLKRKRKVTLTKDLTQL